MTKIEQITKLTEEWYKLISNDHHKDRDCHFYIYTEWSYGYPPKYFVVHNGYILRDIQQEFNSYEEAIDGMINFLAKAIDDEKVSQTTVEDF